MFQPGTYYVGDPGFVLPNDDLRELFMDVMYQRIQKGPKQLLASARYENGNLTFDPYWYCATPQKSGTLYDQDNNGWGFDWGCFGVVPWKWLDCDGSYEHNKIEFTESFECSSNEDNITIGHLHFTFNPK